jgi:outer membrane protein assembly factor BamB
LNAGDVDLGALGPTLLPDAVLAVGKDGVAYLLQQGRLGGIGGQISMLHLCAGAFGGTAVSGTTVFVPCTDGLFALSVSPAGLKELWHLAHPALGSPILAAGAVWAIEPSSATLYALDPATGATLYSTGLGSARHFSTPAATEGFVVAPAGHAVVAVLTSG